MKTFIPFLIFFFPFIALAQDPFSPNQLDEIAKSDMKANRGIMLAPSNLIDDYDIRYHRCVWEVDPAIRYIGGEVATYFTPIIAGFDTLRFNISDSLAVDSVRYHATLLPFTHAAELLSIALPATVGIQVLDSISVFYRGVPPSTGFGSFNTEEHDGIPVMWTLSEPYGASDWWPCKNSLTDKADSLDIVVTCPTGNRVASNGILVSNVTNGDEVTIHWKTRYPTATYLVCLAVTNYAAYSDYVPFGNSTVEVLNYIYPEDSASSSSQTPGIIPIMQLFDTLFGLYPFSEEKYGHCQFNWGGGMEHQTFSFMGSFGHELMAHELAHMWFGDMVTCGSWHDIWLNEGFATYLSGLTYEHMFNGAWWMPFKKNRIDKVTSQPDGSVWCDDTTSVSRIFSSRLSYAKGAMILHQLRWVIGDSAFFTAVKNYLYDPAVTYGFAYTSDLKAHLEATSGQDLTWYFDDWYFGQGYPSYQIQWEQVGDTVILSVDQTRSDPSVSFFELPLPVKIKNATSETTVRLENTYPGEVFKLAIPFQADSVIFDPDLWLISKNNSVIGSVQENGLDRYIVMMPNPVHDMLHIAFSHPFGSITLQVLDPSGRLIKEIDASNTSNIQIDFANREKGMYLIKFMAGDYVSVKRVIVN